MGVMSDDQEGFADATYPLGLSLLEEELAQCVRCCRVLLVGIERSLDQASAPEELLSPFLFGLCLVLAGVKRLKTQQELCGPLPGILTVNCQYGCETSVRANSIRTTSMLRCQAAFALAL